MDPIGVSETTWQDPDGHTWELRFYWAEVDNQAACIGFDVRTGSTPVRAEPVRRLPVGRLMREAAAASDDIERWSRERARRVPAAGEAVPLARQRYWTRERLADVARVYAENAAGGRPTKAIEERFHVAYPTAAKLVRRARAEGLLGPTTAGVAGGSFPATAEAASVAASVGVPESEVTVTDNAEQREGES
jgi:hypothetical protein